MSIFTLPRVSAFDTDGELISGAKLYFYAAGTTTPQSTYSDSALTTPNSNPVVANSVGLFGPIYLSALSYKAVLTDADDVILWTQDNIPDGSSLIQSVKSYGAVGDGSTNDSVAVQAAIDAVNAAGGGMLWFPPGTYMCHTIATKNKVICSAAFGSVTLKVPAGVDAQVFYNSTAAVPTTVDYFALEGLILDGNKANALGSTASSAVAINGVTYFRARDCTFQNATGYGLGFQAYPGATFTGAQTEIYLENCYFLNNGDGVGGDTFDGLDIKDCDTVALNFCHAEGNADRGFNIRGEKVSLYGCTAVNNGNTPGNTAGFEIVGNSNPASVSTTAMLVACEARSNGGAGFSFANGNGSGTQLVRVTMQGCNSFSNGTMGVETAGTCTFVELIAEGLNISGSGSHGVSLSTSTRSARISGTIYSNTGSGIYTEMARAQISDCDLSNNTRYGVEEGGAGTRTIVSGATKVAGNVIGAFLWGSNKRYHVGSGVADYLAGAGDIIASAATITLPDGGDMFFVTGTTNIDTITASRRGRLVVLHFTGVLTVNHGTGNVRLDAGGNKTTANRYQLMLACDGTNWLQVAPMSANT